MIIKHCGITEAVKFGYSGIFCYTSHTFLFDMNRLIAELVASRVLRTDRIIKAFIKVERTEFIPDDLRARAGIDAPLSIGFGQTISQPQTVAFMLEKLQPKTGDNVLDIGTGSGWTAALLASIVGPSGQVTTIERLAPLSEQAESRLKASGFESINVRIGDGSQGCIEQAPFDVIHVAAAATEIPPALIEQLHFNGRLIIPIGSTRHEQALVLVRKSATGQIRTYTYPGFVFVPLISDSQ